MKIRTIAALAAGLLAAGALAWAGWLGAENKRLTDDLTASKQEVSDLKLAREADARADKVKAQVTTKAVKAHNEATQTLENAYNANEDWANQPVPSDIATVGMR